MRRIAVIGAGIAGMSAAYFLSRKNRVSLFEREPRLGGHTNTVNVASKGDVVPVDTGFIVHNERTYPNLVKLFRELGVKTAPSDMSFAVARHDGSYEYSSRGLRGFFATRRNLVNSSHYRLLRDILRFNREAPALLATAGGERVTLGEYLDREDFGDEFRYRYLYPMASAVWSMSFESMDRFPATTLIRFFDNHGMLAVSGHPQWKVVVGGSSQYIDPLTRPYREDVHLGVRIRTVRRSESDVEIVFEDRESMRFDDVVFACHGDEVLGMLDSPTDAERSVFGSFRTSRNQTVLHTDEAMLPRRPWARASWNYNIGPGDSGAVTVTYDMNRLQNLKANEQFCVSLNANGQIRQDRVIERFVYHHPLFDQSAVDAQNRWSEVSGVNRTHFCGAYWLYGFHEDGLNSAIRVAEHLGRDS